jgi:hypothetical protein
MLKQIDHAHNEKIVGRQQNHQKTDGHAYHSGRTLDFIGTGPGYFFKFGFRFREKLS